MSIETEIKARVRALSITTPLDEDPLAEARAEARSEARNVEALPTMEALSVSVLHKNPSLIREGMGVTMRTGPGGLYVPFTVIEVRRNGRELVIQRDKTIIDGKNSYADEAPRHYVRDENGRTETITQRNDGTYIVKGSPKEWYSTRYSVGYRRDWTDYSQ